MKQLYYILIACLFMGITGKVSGQSEKLFEQNELDSLTKFYTPLSFSDSVEIESISDFRYLNVYFFNGECSLCLGKMLDARMVFEENKDTYPETIFIVETSDTILFNFYREKYNITLPILWDKNNRIAKKGVTPASSTVFLINNKGVIQFEGDIISDDKKRLKYEQIIGSL